MNKENVEKSKTKNMKSRLIFEYYVGLGKHNIQLNILKCNSIRFTQL